MKLHFAINQNDFDQVKYLVNGNVNLNFKVFNQTPLEVAIVQEYYNIACYLVDNGASLKFRESSRLKLTPLHMAAKTGCVELAEKILEKDFDMLNEIDQTGMSALHWAVLGNHHKIAEFLVKNGADVDANKYKGMSPLYLAVCSDHLACVECLLILGADVNACTSEGNTPLKKACVPRLFSIAKTLLTMGNADPNIVDNFGNSCLHNVCNSINESVSLNLPALLPLCLSPSLNTKSTQTNLLKLLLNHGANVDQRNKACLSPLQLTINNNHFHLSSLLLNAGCHCTEEDLQQLLKHGVCASQSLSLMKLCKKSIRSNLGRFIDDKIALLNLPQSLQHYLDIS